MKTEFITQLKHVSFVLLCAVMLGGFALLMHGCTMVRYQSTERTLTVIDLHPGGESITLSGAIQDTATLDVNREQGSNAEIIGAAVDAAIGL